jgi:hypothetical protein
MTTIDEIQARRRQGAPTDQEETGQDQGNEPRKENPFDPQDPVVTESPGDAARQAIADRRRAERDRGLLEREEARMQRIREAEQRELEREREQEEAERGDHEFMRPGDAMAGLQEEFPDLLKDPETRRKLEIRIENRLAAGKDVFNYGDDGKQVDFLQIRAAAQEMKDEAAELEGMGTADRRAQEKVLANQDARAAIVSKRRTELRDEIVRHRDMKHNPSHGSGVEERFQQEFSDIAGDHTLLIETMALVNEQLDAGVKNDYRIYKKAAQEVRRRHTFRKMQAGRANGPGQG